MKKFDEAIELVRQERERQSKKWGRQNHIVPIWMLILLEEVGESAQAALHDIFGGKSAGTFKNEIIQVAAVAVQISESPSPADASWRQGRRMPAPAWSIPPTGMPERGRITGK